MRISDWSSDVCSSDLFDVVIVDGIGRIKSHNTAGREPATFDDLLEHRLAFGINLARLLAHDLVVQDGGILAEQAPGLEKGRPVKELHHLRQVVVLECATPYELGTRRHIIGPIYLGTVGARLDRKSTRLNSSH